MLVAAADGEPGAIEVLDDRLRVLARAAEGVAEAGEGDRAAFAGELERERLEPLEARGVVVDVGAEAANAAMSEKASIDPS